MTWQTNRKTTPRKATQQEKASQDNSANTDGEIEAVVLQQIGQLLTQLSCIASFATSLEQALQFNLVTPVTAEALSYALWAMVNHSMSMLDRLKISTNTSMLWQWTTTNRAEVILSIDNMIEFLNGVTEDFDL